MAFVIFFKIKNLKKPKKFLKIFGKIKKMIKKTKINLEKLIKMKFFFGKINKIKNKYEKNSHFFFRM